MIVSSVLLAGQRGTTVEARLECGEPSTGLKLTFTSIWLTVTNANTDVPGSATMKLNRGTAMALANILSGWAADMPKWPAP